MADPGEDGQEDAPLSTSSPPSSPSRPPSTARLAPGAPSIILLDGVANFTAFFEDGRDLLDGSGDGPPGRAVFTALFVRDGLPGGGGGGGADLRGSALLPSPPSPSPAPARLALSAVRLAQYDAAARQLVLTALAGTGSGLGGGRPGGAEPTAAVTLRGVTLTFEAAPRGGAAAAASAVPEGPAAARAAAAALRAARAAGLGVNGGSPAEVRGGGRPRPVPRAVEPAGTGASTVSVSSADGPR